MEKYIITTKQQFKETVAIEKNIYLPKEKISLMYVLRNPFKYKTYKYLKCLREYEYFCFVRDNTKNFIITKWCAFKIKFLDIKLKRLGLQLKIEITPNCVGKGLRICHPNVIINGFVGENCVFHGNNVIGNKATGDKDNIPSIGDNVDFGIGAMAIGNLKIADGCVVGAGAVVTKSFEKEGCVIAGVPAKTIG
jgi:serine O-acetyltransferase